MVSMITVWRMEDPRTGHGPFASGVVKSNWGHYDPPGPHSDTGMKRGWNSLSRGEKDAYYFGFDSLAAFKRWFAGRLDHYERRGMTLRAYKVPAQYAIRGDWQVAFRKDCATLVGERSVCSTKWRKAHV